MRLAERLPGRWRVQKDSNFHRNELERPAPIGALVATVGALIREGTRKGDRESRRTARIQDHGVEVDMKAQVGRPLTGKWTGKSRT